jgi:hypothetical protein
MASDSAGEREGGLGLGVTRPSAALCSKDGLSPWCHRKAKIVAQRRCDLIKNGFFAYINVVSNNRKEVIQCLIVFLRGSPRA